MGWGWGAGRRCDLLSQNPLMPKCYLLGLALQNGGQEVVLIMRDRPYSLLKAEGQALFFKKSPV